MTDGQLGSVPDWYPIIRAARYLNTPPWELMERPLMWMQWAVTAEGAENEARAALARQDA